MNPKLKHQGTKLQGVPIAPMFEPQKMQGFQSYPEPSSLPPEMFSLLNDARLSRGVITARDGNSGPNNGIANGTVRGVYECIQNSVPSIFAAVGDGAHVTIWRSLDEGYTWSMVSPAGNVYVFTVSGVTVT